MSNRAIRELMYLFYGEECMLCGHKPKRSSTKKKDKNPLTYHHIKEKSDGGEATLENGAILCSRCHCWFNKQSKAIQAELNAKFQELKQKKRH